MADFIYVDNSNLFIEVKRVAAVQNGLCANIHQAMKRNIVTVWYAFCVMVIKIKKYLIKIIQIIDDNAAFFAFAFNSFFWLLIIGWLSWEFWPFQQLSQKLAYSETVDTESAVMTKINVIEFQLDMAQQRVIQRNVAPIQGDRGKPELCGILNISWTSDDATNDAENKGYREIWE